MMAADRIRSVATWRDLLRDSAALSERFRDRHAIVLAGLDESADSGRRRRARTAAIDDPRRAARILAGIEPNLTDRPQDSGADTPRIEGDGQLVEAVAGLLSGNRDAETFLAGQPMLEQTNVPLHPSRRARLLRPVDGYTQGLVALVWSADSVTTRSHNRRQVQDLADRATGPDMRIDTVTEQVLVWVEPKHDPWLIAPNLGRTLEDRLRADDLAPSDRRAVIATLARLRAVMVAAGVVWQGFAPRNMFWHDDRLVLIDFEEVATVTHDPARATECLLWHRVFFADCLTPAETDAVFGHATHEWVDDDYELRADAFEHALLGAEKVTWAQRRALLTQSINLEGRHRRPDSRRDGGALYGHELGHFWGDFVPVAGETRLFRQLSTVDAPSVLVACLEVCEAAMEADICRIMQQTVYGDDTPAAPRTLAVAELLDAVSVEALAEARTAIPDWYDQLVTDPAALVDVLLFDVGASVGGVDQHLLDAHLIGSANARARHTESLHQTLRVGLDFLHRDHHNRPFLRYANNDDLRGMIAAPLPSWPHAFDKVLAEVENVIVAHSISQAHPRYLAFPDSGNAVGAVAGSILTPLLNQNLIAVDRSAPAATFVEIQVIEWLRELIGYPTMPLTALRGVRDVAGLWTTGGHLSNHIAMLVALGRTFPQVRQQGLQSLDTKPVAVMAGPIAHYSHSDAAFHLGLGWDAILPVAALPGYTTDPAAVEAVLADPPEGTTPFMVIGVAGNCRTTGLDDLEALAEVCQRNRVWFHADACHGGSLIFNPRMKHRYLAGIERADSVSLDPHKGLLSPYPSSYVVFKDRGVLNQFSRHDKAVLEDDCWDLGLITPFLGSRGSHSLATWMLLNHLGTNRLGAMVEARQALVRYLERRIDETGLFVRLNDIDFYRMAFVFCPPQVRAALGRLGPDQRAQGIQLVSRFTSQLNTGLYRSGQVGFDEHTLADLANRVGLGTTGSYTVMACCPGNPLLSRADLDHAIDALCAEARPLVAEMLAALEHDLPEVATSRVAGPAGWSDQ